MGPGDGKKGTFLKKIVIFISYPFDLIFGTGIGGTVRLLKQIDFLKKIGVWTWGGGQMAPGPNILRYKNHRRTCPIDL